ncbi:MAG: PAS domain S-box protein [Gammaproteobacteria bacterium]|nr:MAG: PAS domain S-box protein [Gammaproteobacteria bacterium]UTW43030.1 PAS domain S-box protein [bacterium SCSIO 12844]
MLDIENITKKANTTSAFSEYLFKLVCQFLSIVVILVGVLVLIGWYSHITLLIQILPHFVPMQYNTALGFVLSGLAIFLLKPLPKVSVILAALLFILGFLTLLQYALSLNFGIDQLFIEHYILVKTSHPGRMAPNTALCFTLTALTLVLIFILSRRQYSLYISLVIAIVIGCLGLVALFGYLADIQTAYGWGNLTRMAVHTSLCFIFISIALVFYLIPKLNYSENYQTFLIPIISLLVVCCLFLIIWHILEVQQEKAIRTDFNQKADILNEKISQQVQTSINSINRLYSRLNGGAYKSQYFIDQDINTYLKHIPALIFLSLQGSKSQKEKIYKSQVYSNDFINKLYAQCRSTLFQSSHKQSNNIDIIPGFVCIQSETTRDMAALDLTKVINFIDSQIYDKQYQFKLTQDGQLIYPSRVDSDQLFSLDHYAYTFDLYGTTLHLQLAPNQKFLDGQASIVPILFQVFGLVCAILFSILVRFWLISRLNSQQLKAAIEQQKETDKVLKTVTDSILEAVLIVGSNGNILFSNKQAQELTGYFSDELLKIISIEQLIPESIRDKHKLYRQDYMSDPKRRRMADLKNIFLLNKSGEKIPIEIGLTPIKMNNKLVTLCAIFDIRERLAAEQYKRYQEEFIQNSIDSIVDYAIIMLDVNGCVMTWNSGAEVIKGYIKEEAVGKHIDIFYPDEQTDIAIKLLEKAKDKGSSRDLGWRKRKDGTLYWADVVITALYNDGIIRGFIKITRDLTEKKQAEDDVRHYMKKLERSNQELDDFAYIASHDLKQPLRGIANYASFLIEDYADKIDEEGKYQLKTLQDLSKRLETLIDTLLYFSRVGRSQLAITACNLNDVVEEKLYFLKEFLTDQNATVAIIKPLPMIQCDASKIGEVFYNLITNGIKYNAQTEKRIEIDFVENKSNYQFSIKDNGIGIAQQHQEKIFQIFKRLHGQNEYGGGTGAGMTIVKKIIERHYGKVWIESKEGEGTIIYFTISKNLEL